MNLLQSISEIIKSETFLREVPYATHDQEVDPSSADDAAAAILKYLEENNYLVISNKKKN